MSSSSTWPNRLTGWESMALDGSPRTATMRYARARGDPQSAVPVVRRPGAGTERDRRQVGYTIQGDDITIHDRRPPTYPELDASWATVPVARLRHGDPEPGRWTLYRPAVADGWEREPTVTTVGPARRHLPALILR